MTEQADNRAYPMVEGRGDSAQGALNALARAAGVGGGMMHLARVGNGFLNVLSAVVVIGAIVVRTVDQATVHAQLADANAEIARLRAELAAATQALEGALDDDARRRRDLSADWATTGEHRGARLRVASSGPALGHDPAPGFTVITPLEIEPSPRSGQIAGMGILDM